MIGFTSKRVLQLFALITITAFGWFATSRFLLRPLIMNMYHQQSLPSLNRIIVGQAIHAEAYYLEKLMRLTWLTLPVVILVALVVAGWDKRTDLLIIAIMLSIAIEVRLPGLFNRAIWDDEAITLLELAGNPLPNWPSVPTPAGLSQSLYRGSASVSQITQDLRRYDIHPPVYYWALALWRRGFGYSLEVARAFSLVSSIGAVLAFYFLLRAARLERPIVGTIVYALSSASMHFGATARNYAFVSLLIVLSALFAYLAVEIASKSRARSLLFGMASAIICGLAVQSHYLAVFPVAVILAWLLLLTWKSWRAVGICALFAAVAVGTVGFSILLNQLGTPREQGTGFPGFLRITSDMLEANLTVLWFPVYSIPILDKLVPIGIVVLLAASVWLIASHRLVNHSLALLFLGWAVIPSVGLLALDYIFNKNFAAASYVQLANPALAALITLPISAALSSNRQRTLGAALLSLVVALQVLSINWGHEWFDSSSRSLAGAIRSSEAHSHIAVMDIGDGRTNPGSLIYELDPETPILCFGKSSDPEKLFSMISPYEDVWITFSFEDAAESVRTQLLDRIRASGQYMELTYTSLDSKKVFRFWKI